MKLDVGAGLHRFDYENDFNDNTFINLKPFAKAAWVISDKLLFQADYEFNNQFNNFNNGDKLNDNHDLNVSLRINPVKKLYAYLTVGNLLDNNQIVGNSYDGINTVINTTETLGRYFIASVKYKF